MKVLKISDTIYRVTKLLQPDALSDLRPFAPVMATPKRLRGERVTDHRLWSDVEKQCGTLSHDLWTEINRADRRAYDTRRSDDRRGANSHKGTNSKRGNRINARLTGGHIVGIDSEGVTLEHQVVTRKAKGKVDTVEKFDQRTVLWMAGGAVGYDNHWIEDQTGKGFRSEQIFEYLLSLPKKYAAPTATGKQPIFVSFGFSYDVGQLVKDFPYDKAWEIHNGKPFHERSNSKVRSSRNRVTLWKGYAIRCVVGKSVVLYRLRNPDKPFKYTTRKSILVKILDWIEKIEIFDCFGFFQMSLVAAIRDTPGVVIEDELALIMAGKKERGNFRVEDLEGIKSYTTLELKALVNMMDILRQGLLTAIPNRPINVKRWHGAGAIAKALLDMYVLPDLKGKERRDGVRAMFGSDILERDPTESTAEEKERIDWVFRSYFGGRSDLLKQGNHLKPVHEFDISSAYPAQITQLPDMTNGRWEKVLTPSREQAESASMLSMFLVRTHKYEVDLPFYPLPFRPEGGGGSIYYPPAAEGVYMRDHVIAAIKHFDYFEKTGRLYDYSMRSDCPSLEIVSGWIFHPASDVRPLAWVGDLFDYRVKIKDTNKAGAQAIKLGINSVYGKTAESVGDRPPLYVSPFYAAAITAGTQRAVVEAALTAPDDIIMFATDGVYATKKLDILIPEEKTLGAWEYTLVEAGGVFVQAGIYLLRYKPLKDKYADSSDEKKHFKSKTRGFSPKEIDRAEGKSFNQAVSEVLGRDIPEYWKRGDKIYEFVYNNYLALGLSSVSRNSWRDIGKWKKSKRELKLDATEGKRFLDRSTTKVAVKRRASRNRQLVNLNVSFLFAGCYGMSARVNPEWLGRWSENDAEEESENVMAGMT
jgi:hypothetical protein